MMVPQVGYFSAVDGEPLYYVYHTPDRVTGVSILIVPPLFEERKSSYRVLGQLTNALTSQGHPVLRFDYRGSGESGGTAAKRWKDLRVDVESAFAYLQSLDSSANGAAPIIIGLRLGATLCHEAMNAIAPSALISIAPVINGKRQVRHWRLRGKLQAQWARAEQPGIGDGELEVEGYRILPSFIADCEGLDLLKNGNTHSVSTLLLQVSHREELGKDMKALSDLTGENCLPRGIRLEPFWERIDDLDPRFLFKAITSFLTSLEPSKHVS